jgi:hypothetical protein
MKEKHAADPLTGKLFHLVQRQRHHRVRVMTHEQALTLGEATITLPTLIRLRARARWRPLRCFCGAVCVHARWLSPISGGIGVPRLSRHRPAPTEIQTIRPINSVVAYTVLDRYFTIEGLMQYSGLSRRSIRKYLELNPTDALPCYRTPNKILIRQSEFDEWMQKFRSRGRPNVEATLRELGLMRDIPTIVTDEMLKPRQQPPGSPLD